MKLIEAYQDVVYHKILHMQTPSERAHREYVIHALMLLYGTRVSAGGSLRMAKTD